MTNDTAKAIATVGIWIAVAIILAFGLFKMNFAGDGSFFILLAMTGMIMGAAGYGTKVIWQKASSPPPSSPQA